MITTKSLLNPQSCGFVKAFLYEISCQKSNCKEILKSNKRTFGDKENMNIDISEIRRRMEPTKKLIQKFGKFDPTRKEEFLSWFTVTKWEAIKQSEKKRYSAYQCYQCLSKHSSQLNMLPTSNKKSEIVIPIPKESPSLSRFPLMDLANWIQSTNNSRPSQESILRQLSLNARKLVYKKRSQKLKNKRKEGILQERLYLILKRTGITPKSSG